MKIIKLDTVDSTNAFAQKLIIENNYEVPMLITAKFQSKGKGQNQNTWLSNANENLLMTLIYENQNFKNNSLFLLNKCIAVSCAQFVNSIVKNKKVYIKWPNDIIIKNSKISGILIENCFINNKLINLIGIGLNVNQNNFDLNLKNAFSLAQVTKKNYDVDSLSIQLSQMILQNLNKLNKESKSIEDLYSSMIFKRNTYMLYNLHGVETKGKILSIDNFGRAEFKGKKSKKIEFLAHGDLTQVKF